MTSVKATFKSAAAKAAGSRSRGLTQIATEILPHPNVAQLLWDHGHCLESKRQIVTSCLYSTVHLVHLQHEDRHLKQQVTRSLMESTTARFASRSAPRHCHSKKEQSSDQLKARVFTLGSGAVYFRRHSALILCHQACSAAGVIADLRKMP